MGSKCAPKCSVISVSSVRERNTLRERRNSPRQFSNNLSLTETHRRTEHTGFHRDIKSTDITEPYSQFLLKRSVFSVCRRSSVGSKCAPKTSVNSVRSVRDITPHCEYPTIFLSQKNTDEQNTQRPTETLSQPISESVTANVS